MVDFIVVAEFPFVANKSFLGSDRRPITVPARFNQGLKQHALTNPARAMIAFRRDTVIEGAIRVGWRAGGRYYQITMSKSQESIGLGDIKIGTTLLVRVLKTPEDLLIEIN